MNDPYHADYQGPKPETEMYTGLGNFEIGDIFIIGPFLALLVATSYAFHVLSALRKKRKRENNLAQMLGDTPAPKAKTKDSSV